MLAAFVVAVRERTAAREVVALPTHSRELAALFSCARRRPSCALRMAMGHRPVFDLRASSSDRDTESAHDEDPVGKGFSATGSKSCQIVLELGPEETIRPGQAGQLGYSEGGEAIYEL